MNNNIGHMDRTSRQIEEDREKAIKNGNAIRNDFRNATDFVMKETREEKKKMERLIK